MNFFSNGKNVLPTHVILNMSVCLNTFVIPNIYSFTIYERVIIISLYESHTGPTRRSSKVRRSRLICEFKQIVESECFVNKSCPSKLLLRKEDEFQELKADEKSISFDCGPSKIGQIFTKCHFKQILTLIMQGCSERPARPAHGLAWILKWDGSA